MIFLPDTPIFNEFLRKAETFSLDAARIKETALEIKGWSSALDWSRHPTALLAGHVQSGKTSMVMGVTSCLMDQGLDAVIYLTSDQVSLADQTGKDVMRFFSDSGYQIILRDYAHLRYCSKFFIVANKNARKVKEILAHVNKLSSPLRRVLIIDDESDAGSMNTSQRKGGDASVTNKSVVALKGIARETLLLQLTATPQANVLLPSDNPLFPSKVFVFEPGAGYLGGNDFYLGNKNLCAIGASDQKTLMSGEIPESLIRSMAYYLGLAVTMNREGKYPRFLCHPGSSMQSHDSAFSAIQSIFDEIRFAVSRTGHVPKHIVDAANSVCAQYGGLVFSPSVWDDIPAVMDRIEFLLFNTLNKPPEDAMFNEVGAVDRNQIIIGGNSLSRGMRVPRLQVVYFCRDTSSPNWDTVWQQQRIFGYDREHDRVRIFMTERQSQTLNALTQANNIFFDRLRYADVSTLRSGFLYPSAVKPTRSGVIDASCALFIGGYTHMSLDWLMDIDSDEILDFVAGVGLLDQKRKSLPCVSADECFRVLSAFSGDSILSLSRVSIHDIAKRHPLRMEIVRDKNIKQNYRTVLSEQEQRDISRNPDELVIYLCELTGDRDVPSWICLVRFPDDLALAAPDFFGMP